MRFSHHPPAFVAALSSLSFTHAQYETSRCEIAAQKNISLSWHAPSSAFWTTNLTTVLNSSGTHDFIFNSSLSPPGTTYNYCNMPHVHPTTYTTPDPSLYTLQYVELIHRHHKRTPYADNTFPTEPYRWDCSDAGLFYGGQPLNPTGNASASTYWAVYDSDTNPFRPQGFNGTCQFPQITRGGLDDSHQHGADLRAVYADLLSFLPATYDPETVQFRVTNNPITSQVASMLIAGLYPSLNNQPIPLKIQPPSIDSLEPIYSCPYAEALFASYGPGSNDPAWLEHLHAAAPLKRHLDRISGVDPTNTAWSQSFDHYFDSLSSRLCHAKPLPHNTTGPQTHTVLRLGEYEYSHIYRAAPLSLAASTASLGVFVAELASHLRAAMTSFPSAANVRYRHNVAHDGSVARLLSILQVDEMVWPGMGAEVVFELYRSSGDKGGCFFVRVLWGGRVLVSSHPQLGAMDMLPVETVLAYFDGLVGERAAKVPTLCEQEIGGE